MTVEAVGHFLMHCGRMRLTMAGLALRHIRMLPPVTESTSECLVFGRRFFQLLAHFFMTRHAECPWRGHGIINLQRVMGLMAAQTVAGHLFFGVWFMAHGTIRYLAMDFMTESTRLLGMTAFIIGKILAWSFVAGETRLFYVIGQIQGQWFMWIGMTG